MEGMVILILTAFCFGMSLGMKLQKTIAKSKFNKGKKSEA